MSAKKKILDAAEKQWPVPTEGQRAEHMKRREKESQKKAPAWQKTLATLALLFAVILIMKVTGIEDFLVRFAPWSW